MKKKILCSINASNDLNIDLNLNKDLYVEISKRFSKFYIIQVNKLINKNSSTEQKIITKIPKNFIIFSPNSYIELIKFLKENDIIAFISLGRSFVYFKLLFLLKKYNCKLLINLNIGYTNPASNRFFFKKNIFISIKNFIKYLFERKISFIIFRFLVLVKVLPKIEILFEGSKKNTLIINNYISKKIKKYFKKLDISYIKKAIHVNCRSYDMAIDKIKNLEEKYITFLDSGFDHPDIILREGKQADDDRKKYYFYLDNILKILKKNFNKEIVICLHPKTDIKTIKNLIPKYKFVKFRTQYYICKSYLVLFHDTSAIIDAVFLNKKILSLQSNVLGEYYKKTSAFYTSLIDIPTLRMENYRKLDKNFLKKNFLLKNIRYDNYIKDLITFNINNYNEIIKNRVIYSKKFEIQKGSRQIIKIVKNQFFDVK